jgi:hypothetical protein
LSITIGFAIVFGFVSGAIIGFSGAPAVSVSPDGDRLPAERRRPHHLDPRPHNGVYRRSHPAKFGQQLAGPAVFGGVMCVARSAIILVSRLLCTEKKLLKVF